MVGHFEAFEQNQENGRRLVDLNPFRREHMFLASSAVPFILRLQLFRLFEILETPFQSERVHFLGGYSLGTLRKPVVLLILFLIGFVVVLSVVVLRVIVSFWLLD